MASGTRSLTAAGCFIEAWSMALRRASVAAVVAALLLPAVMGCLMPAGAQAQTMDCCAKLNCARGHEKQPCISTTAPMGSSQSIPQQRVSIVAPYLTAVAMVSANEQDAAAFGSRVAATPQQSPPELYTRHLALLI